MHDDEVKRDVNVLLHTRYLLISVGSGCEPANQLWYVDLDTLPRGSDGALDLKSFDHFAKGGRKLPVKKVQQLHFPDIPRPC